MTAEKAESIEAIGTNKSDGEHKSFRRFQFARRIKSWNDLSLAQKGCKIIHVIIEVILTGWALWDIKHRPDNQIKGMKRTWVMTSFIQPFGPLIYFIFGRKKAGTPLPA